MISSQGDGAFAPTGSAYGFLQGLNRWQQAADVGRSYGADLMKDIYDVNQRQYALNTQGMDQLLGRMEQATDLYSASAIQDAERRRAFVSRCISGGQGTQAQCEQLYYASIGRTPQQTATTSETQAYMDPAYRPSNVNSLLGG